MSLPSQSLENPNVDVDLQCLEKPEPRFGWTAYAEQVNGRFAMVGLFILLVLEWFTRQDFFTWLGL